MRNFHLLAENMRTEPLLNAVLRQPNLWNRDTLRTTYEGTVHGEVDDIWLRFNDTSDPSLVMDDHESINYPAMSALPEARPLIHDLMRAVEGERLGRVIVTRLAPGKAIGPHVDGGTHAAYYDRYLFVLRCPIGCIFRAGNETAQMASGQAWWFDNSAEHEVVNQGNEDRIVLIVDIRTFR